MALRETYEKTGQWLFRYRSYVPLAIIPFYFLVIYFERNRFSEITTDYAWIVLCFMVSCLGLLIRALALGYAAPNTSGRNVLTQVADTVNQTGMYSIVRHPLYLGNLLIWLGIALRLKIWWFPLLVTAFYWYYYEKIMFTEEEYLRRKFGDDYVNWSNKTPAFIPNFKLWVKPQGSFLLKKIIRQENDGVYALIVNLFLVELIADFFFDYRAGISQFWIWVLSITTLLYIIVKFLKKKTSLLK